MTTNKRTVYMSKFRTFSPEKKRAHLTLAIAFLAHALKRRRQPPRPTMS